MDSNMPREERLALVRAFFYRVDVAVPPVVAHRNLAAEGATWGRRTTENYLAELAADGFLWRVDPEQMEQGKYVEAESGARAYYLITPQGRRETRENESDD